MERWLIVRLGSLGDLVHTLPAAAALRRAHPDAVIDWLVDAVHAPLLELVPVVSRVIVLRERTVAGWLDVRRELRARHYDVALDFQGLIKSAVLARLSGARRVVGFGAHTLREPLARLFYSQQVEVPAGGHVIDKNLALAAFALGRTTAAGAAREFPIAAVPAPVCVALRDRGVHDFLLINPGAAWPDKRWPPARLGAVAFAVWERWKIRSVVLWGPGERVLADEVVAASRDAAVLAPPTGLADVIALAREARLVLSGDTGPLHLATAVGAPAVALFGPTDSVRNGPWGPEDIALSRYDLCQCRWQRACTRPAGPCIDEVSVDEVIAAVDRRLSRAGGKATA